MSYLSGNVMHPPLRTTDSRPQSPGSANVHSVPTAIQPAATPANAHPSLHTGCTHRFIYVLHECAVLLLYYYCTQCTGKKNRTIIKCANKLCRLIACTHVGVYYIV